MMWKNSTAYCLKVKRCYQSPVRDIKGIINFTEEILKEKLAHPDYKNFGEKVAKTLINDSALLNTSIGINEEGNEFIPKDFRDMWSNLLNILFENGFLFSLLNELLELTNNIMIDDSFRKAASLWIWEIFQGHVKN
ncbi:hypothetical protein NQ317_014455 [Molorchus minor]|uniref:Uncharacterized protein n=1 Tax=Molorchus minor TaxID=1323400 RepID=A0ABQ9ITB0_9CUCU|nr:hypothetical protein NQ317_014455 [Molorchus minor]